MAPDLEHLRRKRWFLLHVGLFAIVNGFFVGTWLMVQGTSGIIDPRAREGFFPGWLILAWGFVLGLHGLYVWSRRPQEHSLAARTGGQSGRVMGTVLFTDIVGSTEHAARLGDRAWGELLDAHDRIARRVIKTHRGTMVKHTGDGLLAVFDAPYDGIDAVGGLREELAEQHLQIRAGLHTGEIELRGRDIGGIAVNIASRVMAAAEPSEILVSRTVRDLVTGSGLVFSARGTHRLKGLEGDWELFAVGTTGSRNL